MLDVTRLRVLVAGARRLLAERAVEVIGRLDAAETELAVCAGLRAGRLRLAAFPSALSTIVPAAAAILHERHPSVDLRLTEAEPQEAVRMLRAGSVDVALIFRHEATNGSRPGQRDTLARDPVQRNKASRDTTPRDSGPRDSGPRDSGPRDSEPLDTGLLYAGPRDDSDPVPAAD